MRDLCKLYRFLSSNPLSGLTVKKAFWGGSSGYHPGYQSTLFYFPFISRTRRVLTTPTPFYERSLRALSFSSLHPALRTRGQKAIVLRLPPTLPIPSTLLPLFLMLLSSLHLSSIYPTYLIVSFNLFPTLVLLAHIPQKIYQLPLGSILGTQNAFFITFS